MFVCNICKETLPREAFYNRTRRGKLGRQYVCKPCQSERVKEWKARNPEAVKRHDRTKTLRRRYGITDADYAALLAKQNGSCAICAKPETMVKRGGSDIRFMSVDHDHRTGRIRGLLCHNCNRVLGLIGDDIQGAMRFVRYLQQG